MHVPHVCTALGWLHPARSRLRLLLAAMMVAVGMGAGGRLGLQSLLELILLNSYFYTIPDFTAAVASRRPPSCRLCASFSTPCLRPKGSTPDVHKPQLPPSDQLTLQLLPTAPITFLHLPQGSHQRREGALSVYCWAPRGRTKKRLKTQLLKSSVNGIRVT